MVVLWTVVVDLHSTLCGNWVPEKPPSPDNNDELAVEYALSVIARFELASEYTLSVAVGLGLGVERPSLVGSSLTEEAD